MRCTSALSEIGYGRLIRGWHRKNNRLVPVGKWSDGVITCHFN
jgi:hypothetical protein